MIVRCKIKEPVSEIEKLKRENAELKRLLAVYHSAVVGAQPCEMCEDRATFSCLGCKVHNVKMNWNCGIALLVENAVNGWCSYE